jgi:hypothetical protein
MASVKQNLWRVLFVLGAALVFFGGSMHPRGHMAQMLVDPKWLPGHSMAAVGFLVLSLGLARYRRAAAPDERTRWWARAATVTMALEAVEMTVHTLAYVDAGALPATAFHAGMATPVLTTHLWMATLIYPLSGLTLIGLIWTGIRQRSLGSPWIGWIGMIGAAAHAAVMPLVFLLRVPEAGILFPLMTLFTTLWFVLAGVWPKRQGRHRFAAPAEPVRAEVPQPA